MKRNSLAHVFLFAMVIVFGFSSAALAAEDKWPDNEYTRQIPKPSFTVSSSSTYSRRGFIATCKEATLDACRAYVDLLKTKGFTVNERGSLKLRSQITWSAENSEGYKVMVNAFDGNYDYPTIQISKVTKNK